MYSRAVEIDPVAALYNAQIYCNRAAARMKLAMHVEAAEDCNLAIAADDKYVKAYVRRAECLLELGSQRQVEQAIQDLHESKRLLGMDAGNGQQRHRRRREAPQAGGEMGKKVLQMMKNAEVALKIAKRKDYNKILGVSRSERNEKVIKKAYRRAALKWHPDRHVQSTKAQQEVSWLYSPLHFLCESCSQFDLRPAYYLINLKRAPQGGGGQVQGDLRGVRGAERRYEARDLRARGRSLRYVCRGARARARRSPRRWRDACGYVLVFLWRRRRRRRRFPLRLSLRRANKQSEGNETG